MWDWSKHWAGRGEFVGCRFLKTSVHPPWNSVQITELLSLGSVSFPNPIIHWKAELPMWIGVTSEKKFITAGHILIKSSRKQVLSTFLWRRKPEILQDLGFHSSSEQLGSEMGWGFVSSAVDVLILRFYSEISVFALTRKPFLGFLLLIHPSS